MVTRIPTEQEFKQNAELMPPRIERATRWGIERLNTEPELVFSLNGIAEENRLRLAAFKMGRLMGWMVRVRITAGRATVYRRDNDAPADSPARTRYNELPVLATDSSDSKVA